MDEFQKAFGDVCGPLLHIFGFCTEYNTYRAVIQPHYHLKCSNVDPPCVERYISTDAYLYTGCYDIVKNHIFEKPTRVKSQVYNLNNMSKSLEENKILEPNEDKAYVIRIGVLVLVIVIFGAICLLLGCYTRPSLMDKSKQYPNASRYCMSLVKNHNSHIDVLHTTSSCILKSKTVSCSPKKKRISSRSWKIVLIPFLHHQYTQKQNLKTIIRINVKTIYVNTF